MIKIKTKGRWWVDPKGYIRGRVFVNGKLKFIYQHRFIMEVALDRELKITENVHHINGIKKDNRIENLQLISHSAHSVITGKTKFIKRGKDGKFIKFKRRNNDNY